MRILRKLALGFLLAAAAHAQDAPKIEVFGGYSFAHAAFIGSKAVDLNGWNASIADNLNPWFGLVADFSGHYGSSKLVAPLPPGACPPVCLPELTLHHRASEFLFGPQFSLRTKSVTPFAHVMIGVFRSSDSVRIPLPTPPPNLNVSTGNDQLFGAVGGGVDWNLNPWLAWRAQADAFSSSPDGRHHDNLRVSVGLVFRFGSSRAF
ncbi:MAG TPA: hypothetical protein VGF06_14330 [Terriglobales bacterium]|jgi:hypothetical protein